MKLSQVNQYRTERVAKFGSPYNVLALQPMSALALTLVSDASHQRGRGAAQIQARIRSAIDNADDSNVDSYRAVDSWERGAKPTRSEFWAQMFIGSLCGLICDRETTDATRRWFADRGISG